MARQRRSAFHAINQKIASSRPGAWSFARTLHHIDPLVLRLTGGRSTLTSLLAGAPVVMVTTTGAKSGLPRTVPLLCIRDRSDPDRFALVASNWGQRHYPAWYFNLKANPRATCALAGHVATYGAREASGEEYERFWQRATEAYLGYPLYKQRASHRRIPIMVMTRVTE